MNVENVFLLHIILRPTRLWNVMVDVEVFLRVSLPSVPGLSEVCMDSQKQRVLVALTAMVKTSPPPHGTPYRLSPLPPLGSEFLGSGRLGET